MEGVKPGGWEEWVRRAQGVVDRNVGLFEGMGKEGRVDVRDVHFGVEVRMEKGKEEEEWDGEGKG